MQNKLRLLKFDSVYPLEVLARKQSDQRDYLLGMSYEEYYQWLIGQRMGFSDFLTFYMNEAGWQAREVVGADNMLVRKLPSVKRIRLVGEVRDWLKRLANSTVRDVVTFKAGRQSPSMWRQKLLEQYIRHYKPDVLFIREPSHVDGRFWDRFRDECLIVGFTGVTALDPINWKAHRYDVILTLTDDYVNYFRAEGIESHLFSYGVDERLPREVGIHAKQYDCTFVGYLGTRDQRVKTKLMDFIAQNVDFKWWGVRGDEIEEKSALYRTYQGPVAGIEMVRIHKQSKIVLNEYPELLMGSGVNMRIKEVLNVGSFLLTRTARNIEWLEKAGALATFDSPEDCLRKVKHYLAEDAAREKIAAQGLRTALEHFNYRDINRGVMEVISAAYEKKRSKLKPWSAR